MSLRRKRVKVAPYSKLAKFYDYMMQHVEYAEWADYIHDLLEKHGQNIDQVLDIACGTGTFLFELERYDYAVSGFDYNAEMIEQAKEKARHQNKEIDFWTGDIARFSVTSTYDAVLCLYDSVNYLMATELFDGFFDSCYQALRPGGILVFDICTEWNSLNYFRDFEDREQGPDFKMLRKSYYDQEHRIHHNDFKIVFSNDTNVYLEFHQQRIYYIDEVLAAVPIEKFKIHGAYDGFTCEGATESAERVHFVLERL